MRLLAAFEAERLSRIRPVRVGKLTKLSTHQHFLAPGVGNSRASHAGARQSEPITGQGQVPTDSHVELGSTCRRSLSEITCRQVIVGAQAQLFGPAPCAGIRHQLDEPLEHAAKAMIAASSDGRIVNVLANEAFSDQRGPRRGRRGQGGAAGGHTVVDSFGVVASQTKAMRRCPGYERCCLST